MCIENFERYEKKYLLNEKEYKKVLKDLIPYIEKDKYFESSICNIYYDTDASDIIINSLEKPMYKEKVRLRSYNVPGEDSTVFFEIKKKVNGVVGKRRISLKLKDFYDYQSNKKNIKVNKQILSEIEYTIKQNKLKPKIFLAYDRNSYYAKDNNELRITFDSNIRSRTDNLKLDMGDAGKLYFDDNMYVMEIKTLNAYPLWLTRVLSSNLVYPVSFSKYGKIFTKEMEEKLYV